MPVHPGAFGWRKVRAKPVGDGKHVPDGAAEFLAPVHVDPALVTRIG
jgi:hypothetical protein